MSGDIAFGLVAIAGMAIYGAYDWGLFRWIGSEYGTFRRIRRAHRQRASTQSQVGPQNRPQEETLEDMWTARLYPRRKVEAGLISVSCGDFKGRAAADVQRWLIEHGHSEYAAEELILKWLHRGVPIDLMWRRIDLDKTEDAFFRALAEEALDLARAKITHTHYACGVIAFALGSILAEGASGRWSRVILILVFSVPLLLAFLRDLRDK
jgi:hypothetical protein